MNWGWSGSDHRIRTCSNTEGLSISPSSLSATSLPSPSVITISLLEPALSSPLGNLAFLKRYCLPEKWTLVRREWIIWINASAVVLSNLTSIELSLGRSGNLESDRFLCFLVPPPLPSLPSSLSSSVFSSCGSSPSTTFSSNSVYSPSTTQLFHLNSSNTISVTLGGPNPSTKGCTTSLSTVGKTRNPATRFWSESAVLRRWSVRRESSLERKLVKPDVPKWDLRLHIVSERRLGKDRRGKRGVKSIDSSHGEARIEKCFKDGWWINLTPWTKLVLIVAAAAVGAVGVRVDTVVDAPMWAEEVTRKTNPAFSREVAWWRIEIHSSIVTAIIGMLVRFLQENVNRNGDKLTHSRLASFGACLNIWSWCPASLLDGSDVSSPWWLSSTSPLSLSVPVIMSWISVFVPRLRSVNNGTFPATLLKRRNTWNGR